MTLVKLMEYKAITALVMATIGWPLLTAVLNLMLRRKTPEEWEAWAMKKPGLALGVELLRALGVDTRKAVLGWQRYAQRKAGEQPSAATVAAATEKLPPALAAVLNDPKKRLLLDEALRLLQSAPPPPEPRASLMPPSVEVSESRSPEGQTDSSSTSSSPSEPQPPAPASAP